MRRLITLLRFPSTFREACGAISPQWHSALVSTSQRLADYGLLQAEINTCAPQGFHSGRRFNDSVHYLGRLGILCPMFLSTDIANYLSVSLGDSGRQVGILQDLPWLLL